MNPSSRHNPESKQHQHPTPMRGQTRVKTDRPPRHKREGYEQRLEDRKSQSGPTGGRGKVGGRGPLKGPSKRPAGMGNDTWRKLMTGQG
jgi:hypothetical protein